LAALVIEPVADTKPAVKTLPPVTLAAEVIPPVADINPAVNKLPPETLPVTFTLVNVPTEVMFGCAAVVTVPAVVAVTALVAFGTVPVTLAPGIDVNPAPDPLNCEPVIWPAADIKPPVKTLPPVTLPLALNTPVMYSPVVANTATFDVPPTLTKMLALAVAAMLLLPDDTGNPALEAATPVSWLPLPIKKLPAATLILPVALIVVPTVSAPFTAIVLAVITLAVLKILVHELVALEYWYDT
jgi:hypothetical protein